jgi:hypothetical protein
MSDAVELQFIYAPQPRILNTQIQKHQPASKLVNKYLSTAAQYLNRTKSFHVPSTHNNHNNIRQHITYDNTLTNNLAQSIPANMHNISPSTTRKISSNDLKISNEKTNTLNIPMNGNNNSINDNKPQGFVNTLRRSLRKNKERFYNKRSTAMKSCHSLNTYEQTINNHQDIYAKIAMTPTLLCRREHLTNNNGTTYSIRKPIKDNNNNDDDDQMRKRLFKD